MGEGEPLEQLGEALREDQQARLEHGEGGEPSSKS